jgi:preprotein translocase subunit YajC
MVSLRTRHLAEGSLMTQLPALLHILMAAKKSTANPLPLIILVVIALGGYFLFLRPQQRKAAAARANVGGGIEVGDEVQTIGGVIGTVLEIHGDRYTLLTGALGPDGNLDGAQPTRIVFVRQAIARKIERIADVDVDVDVDADGHHEGYGLPHDADGRTSEVANDPGAATDDEHDPEAGEA